MLKVIQFLVFFLSILPFYISAQELTMPHYGAGTPKTVSNYLTTKLDNGEVVPWFPIKEVVITRAREWKNEQERLKYLRLKRNILRVLPYAIYAQKRYEQLDRDLIMANNRKEERRLIKSCEDEIKLKFNREIKNLTISQGEILIKLIERQTGNTSYELLKDIKGSMTAIIYQGLASIFGHNLKNTYDPQEDFEIENIIREIETVRHIRNNPYQ